MLLSIVAIVLGFLVLVWSAERFVLGASAIAGNLGVSPVIIGITILGFGTSAPEMLVSGVAAWGGNGAMGVGNALGSNIANIALVLGMTAIVAPMVVHSSILRREFPALFVVMGLAAFLLYDLQLTLIDGLILLGSVLIMLYWLIHISKQDKVNGKDPLISEFAEEIPAGMPVTRALIWLVLGIVLLMLSSRALVWGAVNVAQYFGVSDLIIGLTIVAIGTSLPELASSISAALKKQHEMAIGNVIGSNMFNLLAVLGIPAVIQPMALESAVMVRDFMIMTLLTIVLFIMSYNFNNRDGRINRLAGAMLLLAYVGYMVILYLAAMR